MNITHPHKVSHSQVCSRAALQGVNESPRFRHLSNVRWLVVRCRMYLTKGPNGSMGHLNKYTTHRTTAISHLTSGEAKQFVQTFFSLVPVDQDLAERTTEKLCPAL